MVAFNGYYAQEHTNWPWEDLWAFALEHAQTLYALFAAPHLLNADRLESTPPFELALLNGDTFPDLTVGWALWLAHLEHDAVEHALELGLL
ncbi:MAG: hypothetical protein HC915_12725 [Anaerolineae bacterium]|nr:hypothetical protein [Anaerolineae bacterium]